MKANDLMIGDYVTFKDSIEKDNLPIKVKIVALGYQHSGDEDEALVRIDDSDTCDIIDIDDEVVGYPLTSDILEKNGFEKVLDKYKLPNYRIKWPSNGEYYFTIWTAVDGYWSPVGFGITLSDLPCEIDYVHQLQHALRLCGIEKEIIV